MAKIFIGTSGFSYKHWGNNVFYPKDLKQPDWFDFYTKNFNTVELNVTFYRLQGPSFFKSLKERAPKNFTFTIKGSRYITHIKKLNDFEEPLKRLIDNALPLQQSLKMILWQFPANYKIHLSKIEKFCEFLKKEYPKVKNSFEFRESSWFSKEIYDILKKYNFSLVIAHSENWPLREVVTANYIYIRFHGSSLYASNYSDKEIMEWANKIKKWQKEGKDVYIYFNNDAKGYAAKNALKLKELIQGYTLNKQ